MFANPTEPAFQDQQFEVSTQFLLNVLSNRLFISGAAAVTRPFLCHSFFNFCRLALCLNPYSPAKNDYLYDMVRPDLFNKWHPG